MCGCGGNSGGLFITEPFDHQGIGHSSQSALDLPKHVTTQFPPSLTFLIIASVLIRSSVRQALLDKEDDEDGQEEVMIWLTIGAVML